MNPKSSYLNLTFCSIVKEHSLTQEFRVDLTLAVVEYSADRKYSLWVDQLLLDNLAAYIVQKFPQVDNKKAVDKKADMVAEYILQVQDLALLASQVDKRWQYMKSHHDFEDKILFVLVEFVRFNYKQMVNLIVLVHNNMILHNSQILERKTLDTLMFGKDRLTKFGVFLEDMCYNFWYSCRNSLHQCWVDYSALNSLYQESSRRWEEYKFSPFWFLQLTGRYKTDHCKQENIQQ